MLWCNDVSLNCTVATILLMPQPLDMYTWFPSLYSLLSRVAVLQVHCGTVTVCLAVLFRLLLLHWYPLSTSAPLLM